MGSDDLLRLERTEEDKNVCRPTPPPTPPTPEMVSGETLGRFLEIPNDESSWMEGVFMFMLGPRLGGERSSPYAAGLGDGEEGR
jgi:hypothetical protein